MFETVITRDSVLAALMRHNGADNAAHASDLVVEITGTTACNAAGTRRLRRVIELLRNDGHHVCGIPAHGYYIAQSEAELVRTCEYLHSRAMTSLRQVAAMQRVSTPDIRGQLRLPT